MVLLLLFSSAARGTDTPTATPTATATVTNTVTRTFTKTETVTGTPTKTSTPLKTATTVPTSTSAVATVTPSPYSGSTSIGSAGCVSMNDSPDVPVAIGVAGRRSNLSFWAVGGSAWCGYNSSTLSRTPGPDAGAEYPDGKGISKCGCSGTTVYCVGPTPVKVCWDECVQVTPTATASATVTPT